MFRVLLLVAGIGWISSFYTGSSKAISPEKERVILQSVMLALNEAHLDPVTLDDEFSKSVFKEFLESLDGRKRFFLQQDVEDLKQYELSIDDLTTSSDLSFLDDVISIFDQRVIASKSIYKEVLDKPFNFNEGGEVNMDFENLNYAADETELRGRWYKRLKYYTLQELESKITAQEETEEEKKSIEELEKESRTEVLEAYDRWYENFDRLRRSDRLEQYLNVITRQYDPHTSYFSPKGKQDFNMRMGGKLEGIGAQLSTEGELTQVVTIVPGGPVWKDEQIEVNDFILKVAQEGEQPVDITGMRIDDVVSLIRGPKDSKVTLTVKKKDDSQQDITITRDVINLEIARARGAILENEESNEKYGYIDLPMFYNSFDGPKANSSAADVAILIDSLKEVGMQGLVLDLRDNLGGALVDAINISGLFIEEGPVVQVKSRARRAYVYDDEDESVKYDGPLIVLINSFSASASEIVAGALQDYDRALIVGSQSFGKGSVQNFIDLDRAISGSDDLKPLGEIKLTIQKYYRVDGASTQLRGVEPDLHLPDIYDEIPTGERENKRALEWSKIQEVEHGQDVYSPHGIEAIRKRHEARIYESDTYALIKEYASWLKDNKDETSVPLDLASYQAYLKSLDEEGENYDALFDSSTADRVGHVVNLEFETDISDEEKEARLESWVQKVNGDIYLDETMAIMNDLIINADRAAND